MKLLTFDDGNGPRLGALSADGGIVDLAAHHHDAAFRSMQTLIEAGASGSALARKVVAKAASSIDPSTVTWLAPLPRPVQMRDFLTFEAHMSLAAWRGMQLAAKWGGPPAPPEPPPVPAIWYQQPLYYKCNRFSVVGPDTSVAWPTNSRIADYELELACVIGTGGRDISAAEAAEHIFGFTIFNDLTARDWQFKEMQGSLGPAKGKDFDGANVLGPVIVTTDELGDNPDLAMRAYVNDVLWSEGRSGSMHWRWGDMIEHVSRSETLHPGEILGSGTVGTGCGLEQGKLLMNGDIIRLDIQGIGSITTRIDAPHISERLLL